MSISGVRTAYADDEVAEVARLTGARPARRPAARVTGRPTLGCTCDPPWPSLVVHAEIGDVTVEPTANPGDLAASTGVLRPMRGGLPRSVPYAAAPLLTSEPRLLVAVIRIPGRRT